MRVLLEGGKRAIVCRFATVCRLRVYVVPLIFATKKSKLSWTYFQGTWISFLSSTPALGGLACWACSGFWVQIMRKNFSMIYEQGDC